VTRVKGLPVGSDSLRTITRERLQRVSELARLAVLGRQRCKQGAPEARTPACCRATSRVYGPAATSSSTRLALAEMRTPSEQRRGGPCSLTPLQTSAVMVRRCPMRLGGFNTGSPARRISLPPLRVRNERGSWIDPQPPAFGLTHSCGFADGFSGRGASPPNTQFVSQAAMANQHIEHPHVQPPRGGFFSPPCREPSVSLFRRSVRIGGREP